MFPWSHVGPMWNLLWICIIDRTTYPCHNRLVGRSCTVTAVQDVAPQILKNTIRPTLRYAVAVKLCSPPLLFPRDRIVTIVIIITSKKKMRIPPQIPKEMLREIVSYLNRTDDLTPCPLSGVALSALYGYVDLRTFPWLDSAYVYDMEESDADNDTDADDDDDEEALQDKSAGQDVISLKRQKNLISSLAT